MHVLSSQNVIENNPQSLHEIFWLRHLLWESDNIYVYTSLHWSSSIYNMGAGRGEDGEGTNMGHSGPREVPSHHECVLPRCSWGTLGVWYNQVANLWERAEVAPRTEGPRGF